MATGRRALGSAFSAFLFFFFTPALVYAQLDCTGVCDPAIGLVPVGASGPHSIFGRDILLSPGQVVQLEVRIANWDSDGDGDPLLSAWVLRVPGEDFSTGTGVVGALAPLAPICTTDEQCQEEVHPLSSCGAAYDDPDLLRCAPAVFDLTRPDYIFAGGVDLPAVDPSEFPSIRMASVVITDPAADPGTPAYAATLLVDVPEDALGIFTIGLEEAFTELRDSSTKIITPLLIESARIIVVEANCASLDDCSGHGVCVGVDLCDCDPGWGADDCSLEIVDCNGNSVDDLVEIEDGVASDCNANSVPDECDLASGTSDDCDNNGVPDECESSADCDGNGLADICDIAAGTNDDCNSNDIPDSCDIETGESVDCNANLTPDECESALDCDANGIQDICDIANGLLDDSDGDGVADICVPTIALIPVGASGTHILSGSDIVVQPGQLVELELHISNWDPDGDGFPLLASWQAKFVPEMFSSGSAGTLVPHWPACATDADCEQNVHPLSECVGAYDDDVPFRCSPLLFDAARSDYVFPGGVDFTAADPPGLLEFRVAAVVAFGPGVTDPGTPAYGATLLLDIPPGSFGTFVIGPHAGLESFLIDSDSLFIDPVLLEPARIIVIEPTCGDVNDCSENGTCVGEDICDCTSGWTGADCSVLDCAEVNQCSENGTCVAPNVCTCDPGWTGDDCSIEAFGRISLVPVGAFGNYLIEGNEITVFPGEVAFLQIHLADWDRDLDGVPSISEWQVTVDSSSYVSDTQGELAPFSPPCPPTYCTVAVHPSAECGEDGACPAGLIDENNPDHVFASLEHSTQVDLSAADYRFSGTSLNGAASDPGKATYAGMIALEVPPDAVGTFTVRISEADTATYLIDGTGEPLQPLIFEPAKIKVLSGEELFVRKNRFLTMRVGRRDHSEAIRVTCASLQGEFSKYNGMALWVGEPTKLSTVTNAGLFDSVEPGEDFIWIAELECEPFFTEWVQYGERIHVYHELVVPESVYDIQTIDSMFSPSVEDNFATPFIMTTPRWGDVAGVFDAEAQEWTPPNGDTNALSDILDVLALVEGFAGLPTAAHKARWDLEGLGTGFIDGKINISDVLRGVEAFANLDYPFSPTGDPCP